MDNSTITTISIRNFKGIEESAVKCKKIKCYHRKMWQRKIILT